jgi:predicted proteasome-type protease
MERLVATVRMPLDLFNHIKDKYDGFELSRIKDESIDYSKYKKWKECRKALRQAILDLEDVEFEIKESLK